MENFYRPRRAAKMRSLGIFVVIACWAIPTFAQDFEAIERRLGGAVEAGEINLEQAMIMLETLREHTEHRHREAREIEFREFAREVELAVVSGDLSKSDAEKQLDEARRELLHHHEQSEHEWEQKAKREKYRDVEAELNEAVKFGKLSEEEANKKLTAFRQELFGDHDEGARRKGDQKRKARDMALKQKKFMGFVREIEAGVENGDISEAEGNQKLIEMRKKIFGFTNEKMP